MDWTCRSTFRWAARTRGASASHGDTGMRYTGGQYLFNLSTKRSQFAGGQDLAAGTYHLWVTGGVGAEAFFDLR